MTKNQVERILQFYRTIPDEIKLYAEERAEFNDYYNPLQSPVVDGMPHDTNASDQTANAALRSGEYEYAAKRVEEIEKYITTLERIATEVFGSLKALPYYEKMTVYRFYLDGWSWAKVSFALRYSEVQCRRIRNNAIVKLADLFSDNQIIFSFNYPK